VKSTCASTLWVNRDRALVEREWKYTQNYADAKNRVVDEIMSRALRDSKW